MAMAARGPGDAVIHPPRSGKTPTEDVWRAPWRWGESAAPRRASVQRAECSPEARVALYRHAIMAMSCAHAMIGGHGDSGATRGRRTRQTDEAETERRLDRLAWLLDDLFRIPGLRWRVGLDALIGLVPGIGDTITTAVSLYVLAAAVRSRVPRITVLRMALNLAIDHAVGAVPVVGDLFDVWWKANQRNVALLRRRATVSPGEAPERRGGDWLFVGLIGLVLVAIAVGAAVISFYVLAAVVRGLASGLGI
jgi:hypothetical protein